MVLDDCSICIDEMYMCLGGVVGGSTPCKKCSSGEKKFKGKDPVQNVLRDTENTFWTLFERKKIGSFVLWPVENKYFFFRTSNDE